jgi:hypothetical protein
MSGRRIPAALSAALLAALVAAPVAAGDSPIHIPKHPPPLSPTPPQLPPTDGGGTSTATATEIPRTGGEPALTALAGLGLLFAGTGLRVRARGA